jgi:hypothetical protein
LRRQLVQHDARRRGPVADLVGADAGDLEDAATHAREGDLGAGQEVVECHGLGRTDPDRVARGPVDEVLDRRVGDQPAPADHDEVLGGKCHLAHQVRRHEHRAAVGGQALHQPADPQDAFRVQAVDRLVEDEHARIPQQR